MCRSVRSKNRDVLFKKVMLHRFSCAYLSLLACRRLFMLISSSAVILFFFLFCLLAFLFCFVLFSFLFLIKKNCNKRKKRVHEKAFVYVSVRCGRKRRLWFSCTCDDMKRRAERRPEKTIFKPHSLAPCLSTLQRTLRAAC